MEILVNREHGDGLLEGVEVEELCELALRMEGKGDDVEVSIIFVDNDEMARLNGEYRGKEGPTDVLSFECDGFEDEMSSVFAEGQPYQLGDIVIAPDVAAAQSHEFGTTVAAEIELLLVHGILHLCGWDHMQDDEAEAMEAREQEVLDAWRGR